MIVNLYLHKPIVETLRCYGNLEEVVNRILDAGTAGLIDIMDKPACPPRDGASRYVIDITNADYIDLSINYPPNSCKLSLRRLVYWFVENEIYNELGWTMVNDYVSINDRICNNHITAAIQHMEKSLHYMTSLNDEANEIIYKLKALLEARCA